MPKIKLKVLLLSCYFNDYNDASFRVRYLTAKQLSENYDLNVTLIAKSKSRHILKSKGANFTYIYTPMYLPESLSRGGFSISDLFYKIWIIISTRYDIVHVDMPQRPGSIIPALVAKWFRGSIIVCEMWEWFGKGGISDSRKSPLQKMISLYDNIFELRSYEKYDGAIAISTVLKNRLADMHIYKNTVVLHGGSEVSNLTAYPLQTARKMLNLNADLIIIGMINLCSEDEEDNNLFLNAFCSLADQYESVRLMVTGKSDYVLEKFMKSFPCKDRVIYPGWVDREEFNYYLAACNFFVLPLRDIPRNAGRWPNKLGDYFAVDRPVLTNRVGDLEQIFTQNNVGVLCDEDSDDFTKKASNWIESPEYLADYSCKPLAYARDELDFSVRVDRIASFYRNLIGQSRAVKNTKN